MGFDLDIDASRWRRGLAAVVEGLPGIVPDPPDPAAPALHPTSERSAP